uniref:Uncharacterized protein n=1 Tax=Candidatus Kentrum sp. FM TaxID=2126340 RepID=A0A450U3E4_9GAMM|nr:MAG: hypothetical protein BECKFM1743A_GA0114220_110161 [Candidatus Kentron sp. FM]VFK07115.1 MAG: hypothetical protein BECKFM1743B_GA0114221_100321 [Candidatus Kentron sp. FM]
MGFQEPECHARSLEYGILAFEYDAGSFEYRIRHFEYDTSSFEYHARNFECDTGIFERCIQGFERRIGSVEYGIRDYSIACFRSLGCHLAPGNPARNLGFAIDIAIRYRYRSYQAFPIASRDSERTTATGCGSLRLLLSAGRIFSLGEGKLGI